MKGEETAALQAFASVRRAHPNTMLDHCAARKPERFGDVEALARNEGYRVLRRSELPVDAEPRADVVILDTIGELAQSCQESATVVLSAGASSVKAVQRILEPAVHGKPIVFGPHMQNFAEIAETFLASHAAIQVQTPAELAAVLVRLAGDSVERARLGAAARALVSLNRGAKPRTLDAVMALLPPQSGRSVVRPFRVVN